MFEINWKKHLAGIYILFILLIAIYIVIAIVAPSRFRIVDPRKIIAENILLKFQAQGYDSIEMDFGNHTSVTNLDVYKKYLGDLTSFDYYGVRTELLWRGLLPTLKTSIAYQVHFSKAPQSKAYIRLDFDYNGIKILYRNWIIISDIVRWKAISPGKYQIDIHLE